MPKSIFDQIPEGFSITLEGPICKFWQCILVNDDETISIMEFGDTAEEAFLKCLSELPYFLGAK